MAEDLVKRLHGRLLRLGASPGSMLDFMNGIAPLLKESADLIEQQAASLAAKDKEIAELKSLVADYAETQYDKRRLAREIDVAMHGEEGAAKQPSLCDLVAPAKELRSRAEQAERALAKAVEVMKKIAGHPDKYDDGKRSYAIGWAFWNIQGMARAFVAQHGPVAERGSDEQLR